MKILVVFTGGTIGSTYSDGVIAPDNSNSYLLLNMYKNINSDVEFVTAQPYTILSENLNMSNLIMLYDCIKSSNPAQYEGVIVTHGTDTLQYTSAFLSYAFGLCNTPVVVVSANYPLADSRSNGMDNFCTAVDFISLKQGKGVFVAYKNSEENTKIHRASRLLPHMPYSDTVASVLNQYYGEFAESGFVKNKAYCEKADEAKIEISESILTDKKVLKVAPYVGMTFPAVNSDVKAVLLESYHSGTINTESEELKNFCKEATKHNIPIYLTGVVQGFDYESKLKFDELGIISLPVISPISIYVKLCLINDENSEIISNSIGGDVYL